MYLEFYVMEQAGTCTSILRFGAFFGLFSVSRKKILGIFVTM